MDYCVITFATTHGAISAQKLLEKVCPVQAMPVLREISKGCGISLRLMPECLDLARTVLAGSSLPSEEYAFYGVTGSGDVLRTERLG